MSRRPPLAADDAEHQVSSFRLTERLLQRSSGSMTYSQLDSADLYTDRPCQGRWSPEENANLWSKLTYFYANGLIKLGYTQPLHQHHLWDMALEHDAARVANSFQAAYNPTRHSATTPDVRLLCLRGRTLTQCSMQAIPNCPQIFWQRCMAAFVARYPTQLSIVTIATLPSHALDQSCNRGRHCLPRLLQ